MSTPGNGNAAKRLLIFGGLFDPVHLGHLALLKAALKERRPSTTLIIPAGDNPVHRDPPLFPANLRLAMLKAGLKGWPCQVINYEIARPKATWQTVEWAARQWPQYELDLLIGSDNLATLPHWRRANLLFNNPRLTLVTGLRPGFHPQNSKTEKKCSFHYLKGRFPDLSSTQIRESLLSPSPAERRAALNRIPKPAHPYLKTPAARSALARFYIARHLPAGRFEHSLGVARLARELAEIHGADPDRAELAGLLHDASRTKSVFSNLKEALVHAERSALLAKSIFEIKESDILDAIRLHTLGAAQMGRLAQILYVADLAAYGRAFPEAASIRTLAKKNLNSALKEAVKTKILYLARTSQFIHPSALLLWNSLVS